MNGLIAASAAGKTPQEETWIGHPVAFAVLDGRYKAATQSGSVSLFGPLRMSNTQFYGQYEKLHQRASGYVERGEIRTFLLDRMRDTQAAATDRFDLPADFAIDDYFQGEFGIWKSAERFKVVIDFDAQAAEYVRMRRIHPTQKLAATANGVRLTMTVGNLTQLTSWVLEWGQRARVVEPPELAARVKAELEGALKSYAGKKK